MLFAAAAAAERLELDRAWEWGIEWPQSGSVLSPPVSKLVLNEPTVHEIFNFQALSVHSPVFSFLSSNKFFIQTNFHTFIRGDLLLCRVFLTFIMRD